jgi:hypothetical protein
MIGCPNVGGAGLGLGAAKLAIASKPATQQRVKAMKARGLKRPDCEEGFFFMRFSFVSLQRRLSLTIRKLRPDRMLFVLDHSKSAAENSHRQGPEVCPSRQARDFEAVTA